MVRKLPDLVGVTIKASVDQKQALINAGPTAPVTGLFVLKTSFWGSNSPGLDHSFLGLFVPWTIRSQFCVSEL